MPVTIHCGTTVNQTPTNGTGHVAQEVERVGRKLGRAEAGDDLQNERKDHFQRGEGAQRQLGEGEYGILAFDAPQLDGHNGAEHHVQTLRGHGDNHADADGVGMFNMDGRDVGATEAGRGWRNEPRY